MAPWETSNKSASRSIYTTLGNVPKGLYSYYKDTCSIVFMIDLFKILRNLKQTRYSSTDEWVKM